MKLHRITTYLAALLSLVIPMHALAIETITVTSKPYQVPVVELYTSEGCNSCPPADRFLAELSKTPEHKLDALSLAFHVDYWNYLGWEDEFSSPEYTNRQRQLGRLNRQTTIYTPEFFVNGKETRGTKSIIDRIRETNQQAAKISLEMHIQPVSGGYQFILRGKDTAFENPEVHLVVFENKLVNNIARGENAGKVLKHERVVRYFSDPLPLSMDIETTISSSDDWIRQNLGFAAIVQTKTGKFLQSIYSSPGLR
jgi:hypothetical protein